MVSINEFMLALNAEDNEVRERASSLLLNEFSRSPSNLNTNQLAEIAKRLGDESELVRRNIGRFFFLYAKSGRELGHAWINLSKYLGSKDPSIKVYIIQATNFLGKDETALKKILEDPRYPSEIRMRAAETLAHFYDKKGYLSSLSDLLKKDLVTIKGTLIGIYTDRQMRIIDDKALQPIMPKINDARLSLEHPEKAAKPVPKGHERPKDAFKRV